MVAAYKYPEGFTIAARGGSFYNVKLVTMQAVANADGDPASYADAGVAAALAEDDLALYGLVPWVNIPMLSGARHTGSILHPVT